jgi:hypothetical protein
MMEIRQISPANVLIVSRTLDVTAVSFGSGLPDVIRRRKMSVVKDGSAAFTRQVSDLIKRRVFSHEMRSEIVFIAFLLLALWFHLDEPSRDTWGRYRRQVSLQ